MSVISFLLLLNTVFVCILGFGKAEYMDGSHAVTSDDAISRTLDSIANEKK